MKIYYYTFGCKVNSFESSAIASIMEQAGHATVADPSEADAAIVNSCTVTANGDAKVRRYLRRLRRENPGIVTVLCGCMPQAFPGRCADMTEADIVTGNTRRADIPLLLARFLESRERIVAVSPHEKGEGFETLHADGNPGHTRAFMKIEDGCDRYCAYCIIPYARGPVRSMPLNDAAAAARDFANAGFREIVVSGINLSKYGEDCGLGLADAIETIAANAPETRIRFGSLEPDLLSDETLSRLSKVTTLCAHFHLALQSGCDATLKRMRRRYTVSQYLSVADKLRALFDRPTFTTDVITGFPGETAEEFEESVSFVSGFGFIRAHVFPYSRRDGTAAATLPAQVPQPEKERRARAMDEAVKAAREKALSEYIGSAAEVIAEQPDADGAYTGYTERYIPALVSGAEIKNGALVRGVIERFENGVAIVTTRP